LAEFLNKLGKPLEAFFLYGSGFFFVLLPGYVFDRVFILLVMMGGSGLESLSKAFVFESFF